MPVMYYTLNRGPEFIKVEGVTVKFFPTSVRMPVWARGLSLEAALSRLQIDVVDVKQEEPEFNLEKIRARLSRAMLAPKYVPYLDAREALNVIKSEIRVDGVEVVEWMIDSFSNMLVLKQREAEYNRLGSQLLSNTSDGYIPGVTVEDISFEHVRGRTVSTRGYANANTPRGSFRVPKLNKSSGIFRDLLTWGSITWVGSVQYVGNLLKWKSLANTPINQAVGFFMDSRGHIAPHFFNQVPPRPKLTAYANISVSSKSEQTVAVNFRNPADYTEKLTTKSFKVPEGTSTVRISISAFPYVPPLIAEIQPTDGVSTTLNSYTVS